MQLTLREIRSILGVAAPAHSAGMASGYSIDSRTIRAGELFFALRGERFDGNDYVAAALAAGAAGAVVSSDRVAGFPATLQDRLIGTPDTLMALQKLAGAVRARWGGPLVAITGSMGKTTTKHMMTELLGTRFRVVQSEGNWNNQYGLPLSLLQLQPETEIGVFELGMSAAGEIRHLAGIAKPDVGVVTNVGPAHLEFFSDVDGIALAKRELIESLGRDGWAVLNGDDARVAAFGSLCPGRALSYGIDTDAQIRATKLSAAPAGGYSFAVSTASLESDVFGGARKETVKRIPPDEQAAETRFTLPMVGRHNVRNLLAGLGVAHLFGIRLATLVETVAGLHPAPMRGELVGLANGAVIVNDCYNSSPAALEAMLEAVAEIPARRRVAVLGGMMELGRRSGELHFDCGKRLPDLRFSLLLTVGDAARPLAEGARSAGMAGNACEHFDTPAEAGGRLREILADGDVVLLKASRAVRLEGVWDELSEDGPAGAGRSRR